MNQRHADLVVAAFVGAALAFGASLLWRTTPTRSTGMMGGSMMGSTGTTGVGTDPTWVVLGTVLVAAAVAVPYLFFRTGLAADAGDDRGGSADSVASAATIPDPTRKARTATESGDAEATSGLEDPGAGGTAHPDDGHATDGAAPADGESTTDETAASRRLLDVLPADERRVLEPVVASPGLTQIELRDRADFSKSKVSQTVSDLEKRGLLYRERQGRTYRIYPADEIGGEERSLAD
jgi:uncharacterized membrane protein